jgi:hypothetical protein
MRANLLILIAAATTIVGCSNSESPLPSASASATPYANISPSGTPYTPLATGPGQGPGTATNNIFQYGATATLTPTSLYVMALYANHNLTNPQNIIVNVNLVQMGTNIFTTWGGTTSIAYVDNGIQYIGYFTSGQEASDVIYNQIFPIDGRMIFHGFFEDFLGGLIVVIDPSAGSSGLGDGSGGGSISGSIWFKNFPATYAPHPPTYCWFVSLGPYDCRSWPDGDVVLTYAGITPNNGYTELGTFSDLDISQAFNGQAANFQ